MSEIIKTEAVVLRAMKYRETSKIVTFYTRRSGKMTGIVKGARQAKNRYGTCLEPMSYDSIVLYRKEGREVQTVSQCDPLGSSRRIMESLEKMSVGLAIVEIVFHVAHEEEENAELFSLLVDALDVLNRVDENPQNLQYRFELELLRILGFQPSFTRCAGCGEEIRTGEEHDLQFHLARGGPLCPGCTSLPGHKITVSVPALILLARLAGARDFAGAAAIPVPEALREEIGGFLWTYLRFHVSGVRTLKSEKVFSKILA